MLKTMCRKLTAEDARQSMEAHVAEKGRALREKYGPEIGWDELLRILEDREFVRYPCRIVCGADKLQKGEFAHPVPNGKQPEDGFIMYVHPVVSLDPKRAASLVLYQLVLVNYGRFASSRDAEIFGACALGISRDDYYAILCKAADELI